MSSSPMRPWFRFHLLTAVLMMFVATFFIFQNLHYVYADPVFIVGWPLKFYWATRDNDADARLGAASEVLVALLDVGIAVSAMGFMAFISESVLRRREARKP